MRWKLLAVATALLAGVAASAAPPAAADSYGCTLAPYGTVCILIEGSGRYVRHVQVVRNKIDWSMICNYRAKMTVRHDGRRIDRRWSARNRGCTPLKAWFDWYPNRLYPDGSRICVTFYENGLERQGTACNDVHS